MQDFGAFMPSFTLRLRMILLFCVVIGVFLAGTYEVVYAVFVRAIRADLDDRLLDTAKPVIAALMSRPNHVHISGLPISGQVLQLLGPDGKLLEHSEVPDKFSLDVQVPSDGKPLFRTLTTSTGKMRAAVIPFYIEKQVRWLVIAEPTGKLDQIEASFRENAFGLWTVSILLTTLIAAWYVSRSLAPIVDLNRHAALLTLKLSEDSHHDVEASLPIANPNDEVGTLATNFNVLFARLGAVVRQLRQFVSDAAHEMRTPLSVVRGETQYLLSQSRSVEEYQTTLRTIDGELTVMIHIIEGLFTLSMADAGQLKLEMAVIDLDEVFEEACGIAVPSARRKGIRIQRGEWQQIKIRGDQALIRQLFMILIENAIKYSPSNTTIRIGLRWVNDHPEAWVQDEGVGIAPEHLPYIFKRFYRAAPQSSEGTRSGGLGLAIAEAIATTHGGKILCESQPGRGSTFTIVFPAAAPLIELPVADVQPTTARLSCT
jgi:two-component system, OmpR family, sensor kinase